MAHTHTLLWSSVSSVRQVSLRHIFFSSSSSSFLLAGIALQDDVHGDILSSLRSLSPIFWLAQILGARELNPYLQLLEKREICPETPTRLPALYRSRPLQEAEAPPKRRTSSFCADRERAWARFRTLSAAVSSIFCEARGWWLSVGALRNASRHVDTDGHSFRLRFIY